MTMKRKEKRWYGDLLLEKGVERWEISCCSSWLNSSQEKTGTREEPNKSEKFLVS
jgi:hypothetical protein